MGTHIWSRFCIAIICAILLSSCGELGNSNSANNTFEDSRDGKSYKWVKIGNQTWMAENLNYNATGSRCYENKESNCDKYGRLYDWATAMELPSSCNSSVCSSSISEKRRGVCPNDWHIPNNAEWDELHSYVGGINGTTDYRFAAITFIENGGYWWSASEYDFEGAYGQFTYFDGPLGTWYSNYKSSLFSVRCVKD